MENRNSTKIKICCIASIDEAHLALQAGADAIGLVARMPSGPGPIPDESIRAIVSGLPEGVNTFLLTSETETEAIIAHHRRVRTRTIQLVDRPEPGTYRRIREELPGVNIVQVIHVTGPSSIADACFAAGSVDMILLDSGKPTGIVKELGGTGRVHDWELSRAIRDIVDVPVYLAGGLNPENVAEAIRRVEPYGVDLCSGLRTEGRLDPFKVDRFVAAVRSSQDEPGKD